MSFLESVLDVLETSGRAMHVAEIAEALQTKGHTADSDTEAVTIKVSSALAQHLQTRAPRVGRVKNGNGGNKKGVYRYKRQTVKTPELPTPEVAALTTQFIGRAGEYAVMSELLFWGFNVSLMAVDEGIDVVATKNNKYFHIQVKATSKPNAAGQYAFGIERDAFEKNNGANTFYILVMRDDRTTRFVVLPSLEIFRLVERGCIAGAGRHSIRITLDPATKRYVLNGTEDAQPWINAFHVIK